MLQLTQVQAGLFTGSSKQAHTHSQARTAGPASTKPPWSPPDSSISPICRVREMPECFSRPICRFAMWLNDMASDTERQRLLPFVTRLACADTRTVECVREHYIATHVGHGFTFEQGLDILEGVLAIGRRADGLGPETMTTRMAGVQSLATTATSVSDEPFFSKIKGWFGMAKQTEPAN